MMRWELVIFDCDGVLVDSEPISNSTLTRMLGELGLPMTVERSFELFLGKSMSSIFEIIEPMLGRPVPDGFVAEYYARMDAAFKTDLKPTPGISCVLDWLEGVPVASCVASSGPHRKMQTTLGVTGLLHRFDGRIFSATEVARGKPHPDLFLYAADKMNVPVEKCVVIEDAVPGVTGAVAAGMQVFGYARVTPAAALTEAGAVTFDDMAELPALLAG
jgi:HAD superfamily hydrolase (TIGR01509 family)